MRLLRSPLIHFTCIGTVLFILASSFSLSMRTDSKRPAALADSKTLQQVALTLGLDREADVVRRRLADLGQFLDLPGGSSAIEQEARDLGLVQTDPIIQRHIEHLAELALRQGGASVLPTEREVTGYYERHHVELTDPPRFTVSQIYFSIDRHGVNAERMARSTLQQLRGQHLQPTDTAGWGDPFPLPLNLKNATSTQLERAFGTTLAFAIAAAPVGEWTEPLRSTYGFHLIWLQKRQPAGLKPFALVRNQIVHRLAYERGENLAARRLEIFQRAAARQTP